MEHIYIRSFASPVGMLQILSDGENITEVRFSDKAVNAVNDAIPSLLEAEKQIQEYFIGTRKTFTVPVKTEGTNFQKAVWKAMSEISYGDKITYKGLASAAGHPKACRAVGNACGANPIPIIIPCHRVISATGEGGFSGGINIKRFLLELEKRTPGE
ncbi:MAG: methylated-DNA--[protein]-cysteine S-methyltransferase [Eubacteriales bacterium]|nr:methylated-DNA--[protein]-cysteine S-methyltransferase [Eubacteriales bacterium]